MQLRLSDGTKIEIENGIFERKDATGRTIEERPATAADLALFGLAGGSVDGERPHGTRDGGGIVAKLEVSGGNIEITYTDGWKEEIEGGRYELKDALNRTVVERPVRPADRDRLFGAVR
ncbi:hypothetical protein GE300_17490 [Rhodobacteraceae bacterium 2CG4]|uniref:Uncharacterized protein n=1 Tax=Halovulum marinum TaxID=2662447 RepID=A0A6L5Z4J7_9RHOB|nr:hypothetical protein [Halovulum marinum]